ncbi:hypothetical protein ACIO93_23045 [Streptomyces sp. NPDC087903]|uniref:hypothetical protein n=1 Tax=Streptomyces sp. NPDC087903 TaxID=3365819 RepID=UPI0037F77F9B
MLALRLTRGARPAVQLRRLLVAVASAGTGFLFLCTLGHAMSHPESTTAALLRLAWCLTPLAATVYFAVAVARTDPATRPRPGLSAIGLGPARLMAVSATTTALSCTLGSMLALLLFLHLRGDLTGMPFDGAAAGFLAADVPLPLPAALTLLALVPAIASVAVATALRPREPRPTGAREENARGAGAWVPARGYGRFGAYGQSGARETFGAYGRFGARLRARPGPAAVGAAAVARGDVTSTTAVTATDQPVESAVPAGTGTAGPASDGPPAPREAPAGLPWGIAVLAAGLAVESYAGRSPGGSGLRMPGGLSTGPAGVLVGWILATLGLALAGPGLTHLCGSLLQAVRPGPLRLLAGRVLMAEAGRIGRPLGVVCAVASAAYAATALAEGPSFGPLSTLGALLVSGCTVATLLTAAVEAKHARADTTAALLRLGAPATMLRSAAALRAGALLALFVPLTLVVAELAALPLAR